MPRAATLAELAAEKKIIVCCGAGGVGKTTTAASLSVAAARMGRRVLVLTIDPSRRLAEALGVSRNPPKPVALSAERLEAAGIHAPGHLEAWMVDPKLVSDEAVRRFAGSEEAARPVLENRIYQLGTQMVAGLHEYTAMKSLHRFLSEGTYDLVVLDTPPSRNALDFLDAPGRMAKLLDGAIFKAFMPSQKSLLGRAASKLVNKVLGSVFGDDGPAELTTFFGVFSGLFASVSEELVDVRKRLAQNDAAFVLVTTPSAAALTEAHFFHDRIGQLGLPFRGFVLNRSKARLDGATFPSASVAPADASPTLRRALEKLAPLARQESLQVTKDKGLLADLALRGGPGAFALALPNLTAGSSELQSLYQLAEVIGGERRSVPR